MSRRSTRQSRFNAALVRELRVERGITHEDLARAVGVTLRTVQRWQDGDSEPRGAQLLQIARVFNVLPDALYTDPEDQAA